MLSCTGFIFIFLEGGDLIIVVIIVLIFGQTRSGKGKKHQKHPRSPQPTPRQAGPGGHTGGWILPWETEALSFCPVSLMLPYPQFSDPVSFSLLFYFIFGEGKKRKLFSALSLVRADFFRLFWALFFKHFFKPGVPANIAMPAPIQPARGRLVECTWARLSARPSGALSGPRTCLCPDPTLAADWQSCDWDIPTIRALSPVYWGGEWVPGDLWAPGPCCSCPAGAGSCGRLSLSVGPGTFSFRRWALPSSALSSPPPSGRLTKAPVDTAWFPHVGGAAARVLIYGKWKIRPWKF